MLNTSQRGLRQPTNIDDIVGISEIRSLDDLIRTQSEIKGEENIPTSLIIQILNKELSSKEVLSVNKNIRLNFSVNNALKELTTLLSDIPHQLYFFLWSLKNSDFVPVEGIISSFQLKKSIYYLTKFLIIVEVCLKSVPKIIALYESIGLVYFDLAGIAQYSIRGLFINGRMRHYTYLLRKAIIGLQSAIKLTANQGKTIDSAHLNVLKMVDHDFSYKKNRTNLYLDPWHFLYIASALQLLNDAEVAREYLQKARFILNSIDEHQNPKIVVQKELLESLYNIFKYGHSMNFDLDETKLESIDKKLKRLQKYRKSNNGKRTCYSPLAEDALIHQFLIQKALIEQGVLNSEQISYLQGIFNLYHKVPTAIERDKLIFRLNIPPIKIRGIQTSLRYLLSKNPKSFLKIKAPAPAVI